MDNEQKAEAPYNKVYDDFKALKLEDKAKFLLEATFSTVFGAFEEIVDMASETYTNVAQERNEAAAERKAAAGDEKPAPEEVKTAPKTRKRAPKKTDDE